MMLEYPANIWGQTAHGGETGRHAFCFGDYFAPDKLGFGALRVVNEIHLAAGDSWQPLRRANMDILTLLLKGSLLQRHADGSETCLEAGQVQCLCAGRGVEFQQRAGRDAHFWQFWIQPNQVNAAPRIRLAQLPAPGTGWVCLPLAGLRQDVQLHWAQLSAGHSLEAVLKSDCRYWLQVLQGEVKTCGKRLGSGDALAWQHQATKLEIRHSAREPARLMLLALPG
ncbi:MAG: pirin family protein [Pseudomonadota bacterium]|nr:pirin family protein [Pseudomonadota bacterium]